MNWLTVRIRIRYAMLKDKSFFIHIMVWGHSNNAWHVWRGMWSWKCHGTFFSIFLNTNFCCIGSKNLKVKILKSSFATFLMWAYQKRAEKVSRIIWIVPITILIYKNLTKMFNGQVWDYRFSSPKILYVLTCLFSF